MSFDPAKFQPIQVFFDLKLAELEKIYDGPNIPVDLTFQHSYGGVVTINLFDEAAWEVEPFIWKARDPQTGLPGGTFKFGYKGTADGIESEEWPFQIKSYKPVWRATDNAFGISIVGTIALSPMMSQNPMSGTVEEVIKQFAKIYDMDYEIDPPLGSDQMIDQGICSRNSTAKKERIMQKLAQEPDWSFLLRALYFAKDAQGKPGYYPVITARDGKPFLKIQRPKNTSSKWSYIVQSENSVVQSWEPELDFGGIMERDDNHINTVSSHTGYSVKHVMHKAVTREFQELLGQDQVQIVKSFPPKDDPDQITYKCVEDAPKNVVSGAIRSRTMGCVTTYGGLDMGLYSHIRRWAGQYKATMKIFGDPRLKIGMDESDLVDVTFYTPINYLNNSWLTPHYTSGKYQIVEVVHEIRSGDYTTTLKLERAAAAIEPEDQNQVSNGGGGG